MAKAPKPADEPEAEATDEPQAKIEVAAPLTVEGAVALYKRLKVRLKAEDLAISEAPNDLEKLECKKRWRATKAELSVHINNLKLAGVKI